MAKRKTRKHTSKKMNKSTKTLLYTLFAAIVLVAGNVIARNTDAQDATETTANELPSAAKETKKKAQELSDDILIPRCQNSKDLIRLTRLAYSLKYDKTTKLPVWVAWHLTKEHTSGNYSRKGLKFAEDMDVPEPRAVNLDYINSGYDRGHMCPSGDNKWSEQAQLESFLYTNCCPQLHNLNAGDWEELEDHCREWAKKYGDIYIVCGPILMNKKHKTIGKNKVVVPEAFYKVVLCMNDTPKAIGFIYRNEIANKKMSSYVNSVDEVERITGIDFFPALPDNIEKKIEATANLLDWQ